MEKFCLSYKYLKTYETINEKTNISGLALMKLSISGGRHQSRNYNSEYYENVFIGCSEDTTYSEGQRMIPWEWLGSCHLKNEFGLAWPLEAHGSPWDLRKCFKIVHIDSLIFKNIHIWDYLDDHLLTKYCHMISLLTWSFCWWYLETRSNWGTS